MKKWLAAAFLFAVGLTACGGGGGNSDGGSPTPAAKALTISMYGKPIVSAPAKVARAQFSLISAAVAAEAPGAASDTQATVQTLTDALAARGVTASIAPQVMDGTTLHQIVTTQYSGKSPDPSQFKDPSEWLIVNFQLDDMVTPASDPAQQAAAQQFSADLLVFSQWAAVAGKAVFVVYPIQTCDTQYSASAALDWALHDAFSHGAPIRFTGGVPTGFGFDASGKPTPNVGTDLSHYGADCRTPDAYLQNLQVQSIADDVALAYKETGAAAPASGASATQ
ncbi:hypothetical protein PWP93_21815 [Paraburkholderia sp. A1RI-2L]|uniref:hypothetical protein n=1 Tax=Paraburkholderia sp. A1RI-2L TaxID=3028367 RepID=UPI003B7C887F